MTGCAAAHTQCTMMQATAAWLTTLAACAANTLALDNGVGRTPVMGWTSASSPHPTLEPDCLSAPLPCLTDVGVCLAQWITDGQGDLWVGSPFNVTARALKETGDLLVSTGLRDIGCA